MNPPAKPPPASERRPSAPSSAGPRPQGPTVQAQSRETSDARTLGALVETLVLSCRKGAFDLESMARQTLEEWKRNSEATLTIQPTALLVDGQESLKAQGQEGRWLLPVFMAGLREIRLEADAQAADLMRLGEELGAVKPTAESVENLRDWIWMDGAEGFRVELEESFTEALDAAFVDREAVKKNLLAVRAEAAMSLSENVVAVASADLDAAAAREEFQMSLDGLVEDARRGRFDVDAARREELRQACEDATFWVRARLDLILARPEFQAALSPQRLARDVLGLVGRGVDLRFLELLAEVSQRPDPYSHALLSALEQAPIGETIATGTSLNEAMSAPLSRLLSGERTRISKGLAHGLLERASADGGALEAVATLVASVGLRLFWKHVDLAALTPSSTRAFAGILSRCEPSPAIARDLLRNAKVAAPLLRSVPPAVLVRLGGEVRTFLMEAPAAQAEPVVDALSPTEDAQALRMLAEVLVAREGGGLRKQTLEGLMAALVAKGHAREFLLPLAKNRDANGAVRLLAFQALAAAPEELAEATRRSLTEWREPPAVRHWLEEARKRSKKESR